MRRLIALLVSGVLVLGIAGQAFGTTWVLAEHKSLECDFDEQVKTRVYAAGDHMHKRYFIETIVFDFADPAYWRISYWPWGFSEMEYRLYNEAGWPINGLQTYGYCTPA